MRRPRRPQGLGRCQGGLHHIALSIITPIAPPITSTHRAHPLISHLPLPHRASTLWDAGHAARGARRVVRAVRVVEERGRWGRCYCAVAPHTPAHTGPLCISHPPVPVAAEKPDVPWR